MVSDDSWPHTAVGYLFLYHIPGEQEMLVPPKLEEGGICCVCFGGHGYELKAIKILLA